MKFFLLSVSTLSTLRIFGSEFSSTSKKFLLQREVKLKEYLLLNFSPQPIMTQANCALGLLLRGSTCESNSADYDRLAAYDADRKAQTISPPPYRSDPGWLDSRLLQIE
jgi:hypothetical protein